jgi:hypothetical protein
MILSVGAAFGHNAKDQRAASITRHPDNLALVRELGFDGGSKMKYINKCFWPVTLLGFIFAFMWVWYPQIMLYIANVLENMNAGLMKTIGIIFYNNFIKIDKIVFCPIVFTVTYILQQRVVECIKGD